VILKEKEKRFLLHPKKTEEGKKGRGEETSLLPALRWEGKKKKPFGVLRSLWENKEGGRRRFSCLRSVR